MAHEIETFDNVVLHKTAAWHNLGVVVDEAPTPKEACRIAGLDWDAEKVPLFLGEGENRIPLDVCAMVRSDLRNDKRGVLGIVGRNYVPIQNSELADFCESLAKEGDVVKIESAGSIRNGKRVWFLLKGESFAAGRKNSKDEVVPYILASNGHDCATAMRFTPTTVRVVCSNTLHMVIPRSEREGSKLKLHPAAYVTDHTKNIHARLEQVRAALGLYQDSLSTTRELIDALAARDVNSEKVKSFLLECYASQIKPIPVDPKNTCEKNAREKAAEAVGQMIGIFEREALTSGTNMWTAYNAFSGWLQHRPSNLKDTATGRENRIASNLFGVDADRCLAALSLATSL